MGCYADKGNQKRFKENPTYDPDENFQQEQIAGYTAPENRLSKGAMQRKDIALRILILFHNKQLLLKQSENSGSAGRAFDDIDEIRSEKARRNSKDKKNEFLRAGAMITGKHSNGCCGQAKNPKRSR